MSICITFSSTLSAQTQRCYTLNSFAEEYKTVYPEYSERVDRVIDFLRNNFSARSFEGVSQKGLTHMGPLSNNDLMGNADISDVRGGFLFVKLKTPSNSIDVSRLYNASSFHIMGVIRALERDKRRSLTDVFNFKNSISSSGRFYEDFTFMGDKTKILTGKMFVFATLDAQQQNELEDILLETIPREELPKLLEDDKFLNLYSNYEKRRDAKNYLTVRLGLEGKPSTHVLIDELLNKIEEVSDFSLPKDKELIQHFFTDQVIELVMQSGNGDAAYLKKIASSMKDISIAQGQNKKDFFDLKLIEMKQQIFERNSLTVK
ncbi:MAG: hypothetical protein WCQ47_06985 [bacterium]